MENETLTCPAVEPVAPVKQVHPHFLNPDFGYTVASIYAISFFAFVLFLG